MISIVLWSLFGYLLGAIPFAYLLGRIFGKQDIRAVGDGNPGGANTWKAAGWKVGLAAILLEIFKGFLSVALARYYGVSDASLIPVSLFTILGHATMPFLGFRGGKALGVTGGVWVGILGVPAFAVYAGTLALLAILKENAWAAVFGVSLFFIWSLFLENSLWMSILAILNVLIMVWTHRRELHTQPHLRPWLTNRFPPRSS